MLKLDLSKARQFVSEEEMANFKAQTLLAKEILVNGSGAGNDFLGWVDLPENYDKEEFNRIQAAAKKIQEDSCLTGHRYRRILSWGKSG